jgi:hypothetical protein
MLAEVTVKFKEKKPFIFSRKADVKLIEKDVPYDLFVNIRDG